MQAGLCVAEFGEAKLALEIGRAGAIPIPPSASSDGGRSEAVFLKSGLANRNLEKLALSDFFEIPNRFVDFVL